MDELKELYSFLETRPILLNVRANQTGGATGSLSIAQDEKDIRFSYFLNAGEGTIARAFSGSSPHGRFRIELYGPHTSSTHLQDEVNEQRDVQYDYILFSKRDDVVNSKNFDKATFYYHLFVKHVEIPEGELSVNLFDNLKRARKTCKDFTISIRLTSHQERRSFPCGTEVTYDKVAITLAFMKPKTVNEIRDLLYRVNNYLTIFLCTPMTAYETVLYKEYEDEKAPKLPHYCYLLSSDARAKEPQPIGESQAISFRRDRQDHGRYFLRHITNAIYYQERFYIPMNLMRTYWEYKERKVYLDSQMSMLLACLEAIFELIHNPSARETKRESVYASFLEEIDKLQLDQELKKWLTGRSRDFTERKPYSDKVKRVVAYAGSTISDEKAQTLNELRNKLMHGDLPQWHLYLSNAFEQRAQQEGAKVNQHWLAWVVSQALLRFIRDSK